MDDFVMSVRGVDNGQFTADVDATRYLLVPNGQNPTPNNAISADAWYQLVLSQAAWKNANKEDRGDILFIVHGYNMSEAEVMDRHRRLKDDLSTEGYMGAVVSFDWPSDDKALAYLPDRHRAKDTAMQLVSDGIAHLSKVQRPSCMTNVHVLGHSTGAYVIREAFDDADDTGLPNASWSVSQLFFAAGDVSSDSMSATDSGSKSIYRHCVRFTNYFSRHDDALDLSNVKRLGIAPRVGRIGLPSDAPQSAINVDCTNYYEQLIGNNTSFLTSDQPYGFKGMQSHSWYFGNRIFTKDLFLTLIGTDRNVVPTRKHGADGELILQHI